MDELKKQLMLVGDKKELLDKFSNLLVKLKKLEEAKEIFKAELFEAMKDHCVQKFTFNEITATIVAESKTEKLNTQMLKAKYPEIFDECSEPYVRKSYLMLKVK